MWLHTSKVKLKCSLKYHQSIQIGVCEVEEEQPLFLYYTEKSNGFSTSTQNLRII